MVAQVAAAQVLHGHVEILPILEGRLHVDEEYLTWTLLSGPFFIPTQSGHFFRLEIRTRSVQTRDQRFYLGGRIQIGDLLIGQSSTVSDSVQLSRRLEACGFCRIHDAVRQRERSLFE